MGFLRVYRNILPGPVLAPLASYGAVGPGPESWKVNLERPCCFRAYAGDSTGLGPKSLPSGVTAQSRNFQIRLLEKSGSVA